MIHPPANTADAPHTHFLCTTDNTCTKVGGHTENGKTTFVTLYGAEGAMELAKKLNNETCASLHAEFGEKAAFLEQLAKELLVRRS